MELCKHLQRCCHDHALHASSSSGLAAMTGSLPLENACSSAACEPVLLHWRHSTCLKSPTTTAVWDSGTNLSIPICMCAGRQRAGIRQKPLEAQQSDPIRRGLKKRPISALCMYAGRQRAGIRQLEAQLSDPMIRGLKKRQMNALCMCAGRQRAGGAHQRALGPHRG